MHTHIHKNARVQDSRGCTPMIYAAMNGHLEICKWLYYSTNAAADVNLADHHGQVHIHFAPFPTIFHA